MNSFYYTLIQFYIAIIIDYLHLLLPCAATIKGWTLTFISTILC